MCHSPSLLERKRGLMRTDCLVVGTSQILASILQAHAAKGAFRPYLERIMSRLTASRAAFDLIASFEGFRTRAVLAPDGQWTLGFGHTATAREGLTITRAEAEDLLRWDLLPIEDTLRQIALTPLSQNQFDALVSFAFNIGLENFRTSDVLKYLNQGQPVAAALSMHAWRRAPVNGRVLTIDALVRRRAAESAMFLETIGARPAAPSSVIRPQIDYSAALLSHAPETTKVETQVETDAEDLPGDDSLGGPQIPLPEVAASEAETAIDNSPVVTLAETTVQDVVREGPVVLPAMPIPPMPEKALAAEPVSSQRPNSGPMVPDGLSPFPGSTVYTPANGTSDTISMPANDGLKTRLHNAPEILDMPPSNTSSDDALTATKQTTDNASFLAWLGVVLGAALLAFGLYFSWKSGILTVSAQTRELMPAELGALFAAASGFLMLVTSAVAALTGDRDDV
jgi:lysozyme